MLVGGDAKHWLLGRNVVKNPQFTSKCSSDIRWGEGANEVIFFTSDMITSNPPPPHNLEKFRDFRRGDVDILKS